jgi:hypothetical protein
MILLPDPDDPESEGDAISDLANTHQSSIEDALRRQRAAVVDNLDPERLNDVERLIPTEDDDLREALEVLLRDSVGRGVRVTFDKLESIDVGVNWRLANEAARTWAQQYSYSLVSLLNENSRRMLSDAVMRWIESGEPLDSLIDSLAPIFGQDRAAAIAVTEATRAYAEGSFTLYEQAGFNRRPPESERPPAHPRCRCWVSLMETDDGIWEYVWLTAQDELVCPICGPKHLRSIGFAGRR